MTNVLDNRLDAIDAVLDEIKLFEKALLLYRQEILICRESKYEHERRYGFNPSLPRATVKHRAVLLRHELSELNKVLYSEM